MPRRAVSRYATEAHSRTGLSTAELRLWFRGHQSTSSGEQSKWDTRSKSLCNADKQSGRGDYPMISSMPSLKPRLQPYFFSVALFQ